MPKINEKAITSWFRHTKSTLAGSLITPLILSTVKEFKTQGFVIGFNQPTFIVLGIAVGIALITVVGGIVLKKRPDLSAEVTLVETKTLNELKAIAASQIAVQKSAADVAVTTVKEN